MEVRERKVLERIEREEKKVGSASVSKLLEHSRVEIGYKNISELILTSATTCT